MVDVSIIIPVYNSSSTVAETLDSILSQTYVDWEAICVDDGSTDNSVKIIMEYCARDSRFSIIQRKTQKKGASVCRNIGGNVAKGKYMIFLDSDDVLAPWCIEQRLKIIKDSEYDIAIFPIGYFSNNPKEYTLTRNLYSKNHLCRFISGSPTWQTMQPIYNALVFKELGGFNIEFPRYQDVEFGIRAINDYKIKIVRNVKPDCYFRMSGNSGFITPQKAENAIKAATLLIQLVSSLWDRICSKEKSIAVLGLMVNVASLGMIAQIPVRNYFDEIMHKVNIGKMLTNKELLLLKFIMNMRSSKINQLFLKIISKVIDIKLDKGY